MSIFGKIFDVVGDFGSGLYKAGKSAVGGVGSAVGNFASGVGSAVGNFASGVADVVKDVGGPIAQAAKELASNLNPISELKSSEITNVLCSCVEPPNSFILNISGGYP